MTHLAKAVHLPLSKLLQHFIFIGNNLHVSEIVGKTSKRLHVLRVFKRAGVHLSDFLRIYSSLIRSVLEYCTPVWHSFLRVHMSNRIERYAELRIRRDGLCSKTFEKIKKHEARLNHLNPATRRVSAQLQLFVTIACIKNGKQNV